MKTINGGNNHKDKPSSRERQRRGLLAMVHIAKKELGLSEDQYSAILRGFHVDSCAHMTIVQLEDCVKLMKRLGWKPIRARRPADIAGQSRALRDRATGIASEIENGEARLRGLCKKICGVDWIEWCKDVARLKSLVAALEKIRRKEEI